MVNITSFKKEDQPYFEKFNREWIEKFFWMEDIDFQVLQHPEDYIIGKGGHILMAWWEGKPAGTVALRYVSPGLYEFTKMAVDPQFRNMKAGYALAAAAIEKARELGAGAIILYSNTVLEKAIELYRRLGFREVPLDGPYKRSNIKMELDLKNSSHSFVRTCTTADIPALIQLGIKTFYDTFIPFNKQEDMEAYLNSTFTQERLHTEFEEEGSVFFLAVHGERPAGYAKIRMKTGHDQPEGRKPMEIERLYVLNDFLGHGIGAKLMEQCLAWGKFIQCDVVWLGVWEHNERAKRFYTKWGFEKYSQHVFMLGNDEQTDHLMKKQLHD